VSGPPGVLALSSRTFFWGPTSTQLRLQVLLHQSNVVLMQFYAASSLGRHTLGPLTPTNSATVAVRRCVAPGSSESGANKGGTTSHITSIADDTGKPIKMTVLHHMEASSMSAVVRVKKHPTAQGMQGFALVTSVFSAIHVPQASNNTKNITSNAFITRCTAVCNSFGGWDGWVVHPGTLPFTFVA
jgi:hypothetical protein